MVSSVGKALTWPDNSRVFDELERVVSWAEGRLRVQPFASKRQRLTLHPATHRESLYVSPTDLAGDRHRLPAVLQSILDSQGGPYEEKTEVN